MTTALFARASSRRDINLVTYSILSEICLLNWGYLSGSVAEEDTNIH